MLQGPAKGRVIHQSAPAAGKPTAEPSSRKIDGKFIRFERPSDYQMTPTSGNTASLERYIMSADTSYTKQLMVAVESLPSANYDDDASYHMRHSSPDKYLEQPITVSGRPAVLMVNANQSEQVAFAVNNGMMATIALTSASENDDLAADLRSFLSGFAWK
jgi:hypothetical protein